MNHFLKYTTILIVAVTTLSNTGCSSFLDIKPKGYDIPQEIEHFEGMFNNEALTYYRQQIGMGIFHPSLGFLGDEYTVTNKSYAKFSELLYRIYHWEYMPFKEDSRCVEWGGLYANIYTYNVIINGIADAIDGTAQQKQRILAEARVGRALQYFLLAEQFSAPYHKATAATDICVPIVTTANVGDNKYNLSTVQQMYTFLETELKESCNNVTDHIYHRFRLNKSAAYMLLAKLYMNMHQYSDALQYAKMSEENLSGSKVELGLYNYNTQMAVWKWNPQAPWSWTGNYPGADNLTNIENFYVFNYSITDLVNYRSEPYLFVKEDCYNTYGNSDLRRNFFAQKSYDGKTEWGEYRRINNSTINLLGSLPDLYLMLAECEARAGSPQASKQYLELVRKNRMPAKDAAVNTTTTEELIQFSLAERMREHMGTGLRWFDVRRIWDDPLFASDKNKYTHKTFNENGTEEVVTLTEQALYYAIPESVQIWHPNWK